MFKLFKRRWNGVAGDRFVDRYTRQQSIQADFGLARKRLTSIPSDFVALALHFGEELSDTPEARARIERFVLQLSRRVDVYLIEPLIDASKGPMAGVASAPRVHRLPPEIRPSEMLGIQSDLIGASRSLVASLGGMSLLGQALGRPTIAVRDGQGPLGPAAREMAMARADPQGAPSHVVGLDQLDALVPLLGEPEPLLVESIPGAIAITSVTAGLREAQRPAAAQS
jgi:hypothetical protein